MNPKFRSALKQGLGNEKSVLATLCLGLLGAGLVLAFIILGSEVLEGETHAFDSAILEHARASREATPSLADAMRDLSGLGSATVLIVVTALSAGFLLLQSNRTTSLLVALSALGGIGVITLLKQHFHRIRPDTALAQLTVDGPGFPSGHASMSAIVFLTIGALIAGSRHNWSQRIYLLSAAAFLSIVVGLSRVYLGVHWATDVIAGWMFGAGWAIAWVLLQRRMLRRRQLRHHPDPEATHR